jgi:hypothetical protein
LESFIKHHKNVPVCICDSHKYLVDVLTHRNWGEVEIVNIDFHHDLFQYIDNLHCGNWASYLISKGKLKSLHWVHCKDSMMGYRWDRTWDCKVENFKGLNYLQGEFDAIFICRSEMWSPPHLDARFNSMCNFILSHNYAMEIDGYAMQDRYPVIRELAKQMKEDNGICVK